MDACEKECQEGTLRQASVTESYQVQRKYARAQVIIFAKKPSELKREMQVSGFTDCPNPVVIKEEKEEEKDRATNLHVGFNERQ